MFKKSSLKTTFALAKWQVMLLLLFMFVLFRNFYSSIEVPQANLSPGKTVDYLAGKVFEPLTNEQVLDIKKSFGRKDSESQDVHANESANIPSVEYQKSQTGNLVDLFSGNSKITLTAIFTQEFNKNFYAILTVEDLSQSDNSFELVEVKIGDTIEGYKIIDITKSGVLFESTENKQRQLQLVIFES